ncbi:hypothetical protein D9757_008406 [Collybiopsis confluens]|uniref:Uncharacterized protein n=1 Tax=Collybiopsis confluens TaxID=2823264 RepID=A0A8H5HHD9_9AGAR|nr:hypothetical protein D9757_008406 [Collybiopsis confluens]
MDMMVPNNAGNATLQIDPAAYVEQAVKPLETILIQNPDLGYLEFLRSYLVADGLLVSVSSNPVQMAHSKRPLNLRFADAITSGMLGSSFIGALVAEASKERYFDPPFALGRPEPGPIGIPLKVSLAFAIGTIVTNVLLIALIGVKPLGDFSGWRKGSIASIIKTAKPILISLLSFGLCLTPVATLVELLPLTAQTMASLSRQGIAPTLMMVLVDFNASVENVSEESSSQNV